MAKRTTRLALRSPTYRYRDSSSGALVISKKTASTAASSESTRRQSQSSALTLRRVMFWALSAIRNTSKKAKSRISTN